MKSIAYSVVAVFCTIALSGCSGNHSTKNGDVDVYRYSRSNLYDYYEENDDTLLYGLSYIHKVVRHYPKGKTSVLLKLLIKDPDLATGSPFVRCIYLDEEEISQLSIFLDSCLTEPLKGEEGWEMQLKSNATLSYEKYDDTIMFWCNQGHKLGLRITPQRFKEVLTKAMEDEVLRDDD